MGVYAAGIAPALYSGDVYTLWSAESPTPGNGTAAASSAVVLAHGSNDKTGFSVSGNFSGDPSTFEIDVQVANTDSDTQYQTCTNGNIASCDSTNFTFHFDGSTINTVFVRLLMRARTNSVTVTASIIKN